MIRRLLRLPSDRPRSPERVAPTARARLSAARDLEKKRKRVAELERWVAATEAELGELRGKLRDAPGDDWEALHEWAKKEQTVARRLDELMKDWVRSSEELLAREAAEANG